jgi:hypothetical protein
MFDHGNPAWIGGVVLDSQQQSGDFVQLVLGLPADVGAVRRVGIHVHIVPVVDPERAGIFPKSMSYTPEYDE